MSDFRKLLVWIPLLQSSFWISPKKIKHKINWSMIHNFILINKGIINICSPVPDLGIVWCSPLNTGKASTGLRSVVPTQESLETNTDHTTWNSSFLILLLMLSAHALVSQLVLTTVTCCWAADWTPGTWSDRPASTHGTLPLAPGIWNNLRLKNRSDYVTICTVNGTSSFTL